MYALLSFIISMTLYVLISYPIMLFLILDISPEDFCAWFAFNNENLAKIYFYFSGRLVFTWNSYNYDNIF